MKPFDLVDLLDEINGLLAKAKPGAEKWRKLARAKTEDNGDNYRATGDRSEPGRTMLTVPQVADSLNVHPHSVRRWADSGLLQCYRIGVRGTEGSLSRIFKSSSSHPAGNGS